MPALTTLRGVVPARCIKPPLIATSMHPGVLSQIKSRWKSPARIFPAVRFI